MARVLIALSVACCLLGGVACSDSGPKDAKYWGKKLIKDPKLREQALSELKKFKDPASLPDLIEALKIDGEHRPDVAFLMGELKDKSAVQPLIAGLDFAVGAGRDKESKEKNRANTKIAEALGKLGDPAAVEPLSKLLKSRDQYVQLAAVRALGMLKAPQAVDPLMDIAENNENNFMIKNAIISLGDIGDPKAIPLLIKMMFFERGVSFYRESSYALFQFGKDAVQPLLDTYEGKNELINSMKLDPAVAPAKIAVVLGDIGDARGLPVIRKIATFDDDTSPMGMGPLARANAIRALGLLGDKEAVPILKKGLFEIDVSMREFPTEAIGLIGDRSVCPDLFAAASHEPYWTDCKKAGYDDESCKNSEWEVRQLSSEWLSRLCDHTWADKYKALLDGEKDEKVKRMLEVDGVRMEAARECQNKADCWVGKLKFFAPEGAPKEQSAAAARVRDKAGFELGYLADPATAPALLAALQDPDLEARFAIDIALLRLLPKDGADRVEKILEDEYGKATYIKVNEDLKRLAVKMRRGY